MTGPADVGGGKAATAGGPGGILDDLRKGRIQGDDARLKAATDALEGAFYQELFKAMRETIPDSGLVGGGSGKDAFTTLMDQHLSEVAASQSEGGLGRALYRWFAGGEGG